MSRQRPFTTGRRISLILAAVLALTIAGTGPAAAVPSPDQLVEAGRAAARSSEPAGGADPSGQVSTPERRQAQLAAARAGRSTPDDQVVLIVHTRSAQAVASVAARAQRAAAADRSPLSVRQRLAARRLVSIKVPKAQAARVISQLSADPDVARVELAVSRDLLEVPNDPYFSAPPDLPPQSTYFTPVRAVQAWYLSHSSSAIRIAIIDSGVDLTHPDLQGKVVGRFNAIDGTADVTDLIGHGTFVAGVAAARTGNGVGVAGSGYNATILAIKVADDQGYIYSDAIIAGIYWAVDQGARIINLSLGSGQPSTDEQDAVNYAVQHGVLVVSAAGNYGQDGNPVIYPAGYPNSLAVGATAGTGRASFSEFGSWVDVGAPGVDIVSTSPVAGSVFFGAGGYAAGDGTSFSSPMVAGEAALLLGRYPTLRVSDLKVAIVGSATPLVGQGLGAGRVDFRSAFDHIRPGGGHPVITAPANRSVVRGVVTLVASSSAPTVRFRVDGGWLGRPVPVTGGSARLNWSTWGLSSGPHTIMATQCSVSGLECGLSATPVSVTVANTTPTLTAPAANSVRLGAVSFAASAPGGTVAFFVDGIKRAVAAAPFRFLLPAGRLTAGVHQAWAVQCSSAASICAGATSRVVTFGAGALHPTITGLLPTPFSPNGDGRSDTTTLRYHLPDRQDAAIAVTTSSGQLVRGTFVLGQRGPGDYSWTWDGRTNTGAGALHSYYTIRLMTSRASGPITLRGAVTRLVRVDT